MPAEPPSIAGGRRLRFTRFGLSVGLAATAAIFFITLMLYLPGAQTQADATSARGAASLMTTIAGFPTSLLSARFAQNLSGIAAWVGIAAIPILNGAVLGAAVDVSSALIRRPS